MPCRLPVLLKALLRLLWDVHTDQGPTPEPVRAALLHGATQCLILLDHCCQGQVKVSLSCLQGPLPSQPCRVWNSRDFLIPSPLFH